MDSFEAYLYKVKFTPPYNSNYNRNEQARQFLHWQKNIGNELSKRSLVDGFSCMYRDGFLVFGTDDEYIYGTLLSIDGSH